jgi:cellobiose dehydrogenase (acceptor)
MTAQPIVDPWLTDKDDEAILWQAVQDTFSNYKNGILLLLTIGFLCLTQFLWKLLVSGLVMISPDNTTTLQDFFNNYPRVRLHTPYTILHIDSIYFIEQYGFESLDG